MARQSRGEAWCLRWYQFKPKHRGDVGPSGYPAAVKANLLPTSCRLCAVKLPAQAGVWLEDRKIALCLGCHAQDQARARETTAQPVALQRESSVTTARVRLLWNKTDRVFMARSFAIAGGLLEAFMHACGEAGCSYSSSLGNHGRIELVPAVIERLEAYGFKADLVPELAVELEKKAALVRAGSVAGALRAEKLDRRAAELGKTVRPYQKVGISFLSSLDRAFLTDPTGCVDGDAIVTISRGGFTTHVALKKLFHSFNGGKTRGHKWDLSIPTCIRSLTNDGYFKRHLVRKVIDSGEKEVVELRLKSGKKLKLTPDHEVCVATDPPTFVRVDSLKPGDVVLSNGKRACPLCGTTEDLIWYYRAVFLGYCRTCMYRRKRNNNVTTGRTVVKGGYIEISTGLRYHPSVARKRMRAEQRGAKQAHICGVLEHRLVIEAHMNGMTLKQWLKVCRTNSFKPHHKFLSDDVDVHHKNGIKWDNRLKNLEAMTRPEHAKEHGSNLGFLKLHGGISGKGGRVCFIPVEDRVVSVKPAGKTRVYDVVCDDPFRNFVANKIVVHNCGKGLQALGALDPKPRAVIVCKAIMKGCYVGDVPRGGWADEVRKWLGLDVKITILSGRASFRWPEENEIVVTNAAILPKSPGESKVVNGKIVGPPPEVPAATEPPEGVVLIVDEAHEYTNPKAQQTKRIRHMVRLVHRKKGKAWALTATPIANKHDDLWDVLEVFGLAELVYGSAQRYSSLWGCTIERVSHDRAVRKWGEPEPEVVDLLRPWMLRRNKKDVLPELPKLTFDTIVIEVDKATLKLCDAAVGELKRAGFDLDKAIEFLDGGKGGISFQALSQAMEALSRVKAPAALEYVAEIETSGEPTIFFAAHVAVVEAVSKRRGWGMITGERSTINVDGTPRTVPRAEVVRAFQDGELEHGVAGTIQAMGTGATLTRATRAFFHSRLPSAIKNLQAIGRIERLGQEHPMRVTNLAANHTLDIRLAEIIETKLDLHANVIDAAAVPAEDLGKILDNTRGLDVAATKVMEGPALRPRLERGH